MSKAEKQQFIVTYCGNKNDANRHYNNLPYIDCCHDNAEQSNAKLLPLPVGLSNKQCCLLFKPLTIFKENDKNKIRINRGKKEDIFNYASKNRSGQLLSCKKQKQSHPIILQSNHRTTSLSCIFLKRNMLHKVHLRGAVTHLPVRNT